MAENRKTTQSGAHPKSAKLGFLTGWDRDFLGTPSEERPRKFLSANNVSEKHKKIKKYAKLAIEDLLIVIQNYDQDDLREIISIDDFRPLLTELVKKIGSENRGKKYHGPFYLNLVKAIETGMLNNEIRSKSGETINIKVESSLLVFEP